MSVFKNGNYISSINAGFPWIWWVNSAIPPSNDRDLATPRVKSLANERVGIVGRVYDLYKRPFHVDMKGNKRKNAGTEGQ